MKETDFYPELTVKLSKYLSDSFGPDYEIHVVHNLMAGGGDMAGLADLIFSHFKLPKRLTYLPALKLDIVVGILDRFRTLRLIVVEVKYGSPLKLIDYSQLLGYMHVGRSLPAGLLLLVNSNEISPISSDFQRDINSGQLLMTWSKHSVDGAISFRQTSGLCVFTLGNGLDIVDTASARGVSDWSELRDFVVNSDLSVD